MTDGGEGETNNTTPNERDAKRSRSNAKCVRRPPPRDIKNTATEIKPTLINDPASIKTIEFEDKDFLKQIPQSNRQTMVDFVLT